MIRNRVFIVLLFVFLASVGGALAWGIQTGHLKIGADTGGCQGDWVQDPNNAGTCRPAGWIFCPTGFHYVTTTHICEKDATVTGGGSTTTPAPTISLTPTAVVVTAGTPAALSWSTENATSVEVAGYPVLGTKGSISVAPTTTTNYVFHAKGSNNREATAGVTVTVNPAPPPPPTTTGGSGSTTGGGSTCTTLRTLCPFPTVDGFAAPKTIHIGESTTITWSATNATAVFGSFYGDAPIGTAGSYVVSPTQTTSYLLRATGTNGLDVSRTITVTVLPALPTLAVSANSPVVTVGQSVTLSWQTANATTVGLAGYPQSATPSTSGSYQINYNVPGTYTYTFAASGTGGSTTAQTTVVVTPQNETLVAQGTKVQCTTTDTRTTTDTFDTATPGQKTNFGWEIDGTEKTSAVISTNAAKNGNGLELTDANSLAGGSITAWRMMQATKNGSVSFDIRPHQTTGTLSIQLWSADSKPNHRFVWTYLMTDGSFANWTEASQYVTVGTKHYATNQWMNVKIEWNEDQKGLNLYVDGQKINSSLLPFAYPASNTATGPATWIGIGTMGGNPTTTTGVYDIDNVTYPDCGIPPINGTPPVNDGTNTPAKPQFETTGTYTTRSVSKTADTTDTSTLVCSGKPGTITGIQVVDESIPLGASIEYQLGHQDSSVSAQTVSDTRYIWGTLTKATTPVSGGLRTLSVPTGLLVNQSAADGLKLRAILTGDGTATPKLRGFRITCAPTVSTPTITTVAPATTAKIGDTIIVSGTNFTPTDNWVLIDGVNAATIKATSVDGTSLSLVVPDTLTTYPDCKIHPKAGTVCPQSVTTKSLTAGNHTLSIKNDNGVSSTFAITIASGGIVIDHPVNPPTTTPTLTGVSPASAKVGDTVMLTGTNFTGADNWILIDGTNVVTLTAVSGNTTTASWTVPAKVTTYPDCKIHPVTGTACPGALTEVNLIPGSHTVSVKTVNGVSNTLAFTVNDTNTTSATPTLSSVSPTSAKIGETITLTGTNFTATGNSVLVDDANAATTIATSGNGTTITISVPENLSRPSTCPIYPASPAGTTCGAQVVTTPLSVGTHTLRVGNVNGFSNTVSFTRNGSTGALPPEDTNPSTKLAGVHTIQVANGRFMTAMNGGGIEGLNALHSDARIAKGWEQFTFVQVHNNVYGIQTANGRYLTAIKGGGIEAPEALHTDAKAIKGWEQFTFVQVSGDTYAIQTVNGRYLTAVNGGGVEGPNSFHTDARHINGWEKFTIK